MKKNLQIITAFSLYSLLSMASWGMEIKLDDEVILPEEVVWQDTATARTADIASIAQEFELEMNDVAQAIKFQDDFSVFAEDIVKRFPNQISRIWLDSVPSEKANIQFVGRAPAVVVPENVYLTGGGVLTMNEHERRAELATDALKDAGYRNFLTHFDSTTGKILVEMVVKNLEFGPRQQQVFDVVRDYIWLDQELTGKALVVTVTDIDLNVIERSGEIYTLEHSRGGNWLRDEDNQMCTSGWSVSGPHGDGIVTAAHCVGLNTFEESSTISYKMIWRSQVRNRGDAEYHTTLNHIELAEFFASSTEIRDVESTKKTRLMFPGNSVCVYGRSSNSRSCAHSIVATGVTVTFTDGVTVSKLVRASGDTSIGGDSGGGWSWSTTAWGVHSGSNNVDSFFTPIGRVEKELDVDVKIAL